MILALLLFLAAMAWAERISGKVNNGTTGKPAAGVNVTLVDPMAGMAELATAKTDAQGQFKIEAPAAQGPRLAKAEKGGVFYFKMITPGMTSIDLDVYEAAPTVEGITGAADVLKLQAQGSTLQAVELFAMKNESKPPRTLASKSTFEFVLPDGAQIDGADAQGPNGQPISATTTPGRDKNHYTYAYPLKPGETRFQVSYHMPYTGTATFTPKLVQSFDHFVLVIPATIKFSAKDPKQFQPMTNRPDTTVEVSMHAKSSDDLGYSLSGTGEFPEEKQSAQAEGGGGAPVMGGSAGAPDNRPGGGLGKPGEEPDGLAKYRWYILVVLATVLVGGGIWTHERTVQENASSAIAVAPATVARTAVGVAAMQPPVSAAPQPAASDLLLAALKEELFQLEVERQQGKLAPGEYEKARSAVEQTLQRALNRRSS
jgi:hypothetical protein